MNGMKKISVEGGSAVPLTRTSNSAMGGSWGEDGNIVAVPIAQQPLSIVSETGGGTPKHLLELEAGESVQGWPSILHGGRAVLYTSNLRDGSEVRVFTFASHKVKTLVKAGSRAMYLARGHLAYIDGGSLFLVPFDVNALETHGTPVPLLTGVFTGNSNGFSVSRNGVLAVRLGDSGSGISTLQLIDNHSGLKPLLTTGT